MSNLMEILNSSVGNIDEKKLRRLSETLEAAYSRPLTDVSSDEPMLIRRAMIRHLKHLGVSPGNLQAMEQLFMGTVRRAAVKGLIPAPPEGPWTRLWQTVIDKAADKRPTKSLLRTLAAWATERELQPSEVDTMQLQEWCDQCLGGDNSEMSRVRRIIEDWANDCHETLSDATVFQLNERLRRKAQRGTVFNELK